MSGSTPPTRPPRQVPPDSFARAVEILLHFATSHDWERHAREAARCTVHEFDDRHGLVGRLGELGCELPPELPPGLVATTFERSVFVLSRSAVAKIRPEFLLLQDGWERLIAHELAHAMHESRVGSADLLGPRWFYEGLACTAAGQQLFELLPGTDLQGLGPFVHHRGRSEYARVEAVFRRLLQAHSLEELVLHAARGTLSQVVAWADEGAGSRPAP